MSRAFPIVIVIGYLVANLAAQSASPSPTPTPAESEDVVKITTSIIQVDVTVTDRSGKVIRDLRPEEIEIYENGKKQQISNFSFVSNVRETTEGQKKDRTPAPMGPPTTLKPEDIRRTVALVVDDLTLSFESTYYVRRALKKFVDEQMQPGDLVAIIRAGAGVGALQQFTSDKRVLYAAIERVKWNSLGSGGIGAFAPLEAKSESAEPDEEPAPGDRTEEGRQREFNDLRSNYFVAGTLGAVGYVVRGMSELPGRKSVMLLSDGFRLFNTDASGQIEASRIMESLRRLIDQANRASVVIYTLDPRGLQVTGLTAADNTSGRTSDEIREEERSRGNDLRDTQDGLVYLARQTGGTAFINNNDLSAGIRRVLDDQSYYLIAYEPDDETFDPKTRRFNKLDIRVLRKNTRVRYRSGFFGVSDDAAGPKAASPQGDIMYALTSPFAVNEIGVRLNAFFGARPDRSVFVRSLLHVTAKDLTFTDGPDNSKIAKFDVVAVSFGDNGSAVDQLSKNYTLTLRKDSYEKFLRTGFVYDISFPVKKPGAYQLRLALRDSATKKIGSATQFVEVPNLKKNRLTLSGAALENITFEEWQKRNAGQQAGRSDPLMDTSVRQFKRGTVLNFGLGILNAKTAGTGGANLISQVKLYKDGKLLYEGETRSVPEAGPAEKVIPFISSLSLADKMTAGEYVLQVDVTDNNAKGKYKTARQFISFDIIE